MSSALYTGWVRHRRYRPQAHEFRYRVFMLLLRLDELPGLFDKVPGWSARGWALAQFRREDYLGDPALSLEQAVKQRVAEVCGETPAGPVYMLANLRYFGFLMNPIACYYCYAEDGETLQYVVAEVTNTPWHERHSYVLPAQPGQRWLRAEFDKEFHVSPFNPMDMRYHWRSNQPQQQQTLQVHMANSREGHAVFDASLTLERRELTAGSLVAQLARYPFMTLKVATAIYWQALRLWLKGNPFYSHPNKTQSENRS